VILEFFPAHAILGFGNQCILQKVFHIYGHSLWKVFYEVFAVLELRLQGAFEDLPFSQEISCFSQEKGVEERADAPDLSLN
jgi:hypothetical protein